MTMTGRFEEDGLTKLNWEMTKKTWLKIGITRKEKKTISRWTEYVRNSVSRGTGLPTDR